MRTIKTILVPTDFSAASLHALEYARDIADTFGASLHLIHVLENPYVAGGYMEMYAPPPADYLDSLDESARGRLEEQLTPEEKAKYSAVFLTRMGAPAREILDYLSANAEIDLVVMATAGRGRVARLVMGSVAEKIVRAAPCPVLTINPHDRSETGAAPRAA